MCLRACVSTSPKVLTLFNQSHSYVLYFKNTGLMYGICVLYAGYTTVQKPSGSLLICRSRLGHGDIESAPLAAPLKVETLVMLK